MSTCFAVSGVCCSTEESVLRKRLDGTLGPRSYRFNGVTAELEVDDGIDERRVLAEVHRAGFAARRKWDHQTTESFWERHQTGVMAGMGLVLTVAGAAAEYAGAEQIWWRGLLLAAIGVGGWKIAMRAVRSLSIRALDMNVLMSLAVLGALCIDRWTEGAAVIVLFSVALMLETYSAARTRRAIRSLMALAPDQVRRVTADGEALVAADEILPGERILIRPGEKILLDGIVDDGVSWVTEAAVTGEPNPVEKIPGRNLFAGSLNGTGSLTLRVSRRFQDTTLAHVVHLIEEAQQQRAPVQSSVDRFARVYTPAMLLLAAGIAFLPPLVTGGSLDEWVYRALVLLVIACPCALVISTPVTLVSALTNAARHGVLVKGGKYLEILSRVRAIAFDKTGTLTEGKPRVTDLSILNGDPEEKTLRLLAAIEGRSEHPLAGAVLAEAVRHDVDYRAVQIEGFEALPGLGVRAEIGGTAYYLGNEELARRYDFWSAEAAGAAKRYVGEGKTVVVLGVRGKAHCVLAASDTAREQSRRTLNRLRGMGIPEMVLLSGDQAGPTERTASLLGLSSWRAGLLPGQKVAAVGELKQRHGVIAMVGDGINDAPALAASSVGIAMGVSGSDAALETADVVLMADDISRLPHLIHLSRAALRVVRQNIALALGLKFVFLVLGVLGYSTLWMALLADDGAALAVIANGLRLLSTRDDG